MYPFCVASVWKLGLYSRIGHHVIKKNGMHFQRIYMFLALQSHAAQCSSQRVCFTYTFRHDFTTQILASLRKHCYLYSRSRLVPGCLTFAPSPLSSSQVPFVRLYSVGYWSSAHDLNFYVNQGGANILNHRETCPSGLGHHCLLYVHTLEPPPPDCTPPTDVPQQGR